MQSSRLWEPLKIAGVEVKHRIGMPGLSRFRASDEHVPTDMMREYYGQRSQVPGTLLITEAGLISPSAGGFPNGPGLWSEQQIEGWRRVTREVHRNACVIICQLIHVGRAASPKIAEKEGFDIVSASPIPYDDDAPVPKMLSTADIDRIANDFARAAENAISAGFDGVELHGGNGYLIDCFIQDVSNSRTDEYGGSVRNRSRFVTQVMKAVSDAIGSHRVGIRLSPWSRFQGMRMTDPIDQFSYVITAAQEIGLGYIHLIEARVHNNVDLEHPVDETLDFAIRLWSGPILLAGGYRPENARFTVDQKFPDKDIIVMFGRYFIANPDLVFRIREGVDLANYDRSNFYAILDPAGYTDYPYSKAFLTASR